jgi:hypothetical protein
MEEGILSEALMTLGIPTSVVQRGCIRQGTADHCLYVLESPVTDALWTGARAKVG